MDSLEEAKATLRLSGKVAQSFLKQLGALAPILIFPAATLGRRPGFQPSIMSDRYWFAKLYKLVTYYEILDQVNFTYAGFVMHFIPVFHGMYYDVLKNYQNNTRTKVSVLWLKHFDGFPGARETGSMDGARHSIVTGVTALGCIRPSQAYAAE
jgi:hypothetical protein